MVLVMDSRGSEDGVRDVFWVVDGHCNIAGLGLLRDLQEISALRLCQYDFGWASEECCLH